MPFVVDAIQAGSPYQQKFDYDGRTDGQPVYVGWADPGVDTSEAKWRIFKMTYSGSNVTAVQFAGGSIRFNKVWDSRTTYVYS